MESTKKRLKNCIISSTLIVALFLTGTKVQNMMAKADITNPVDTGRGYEYSKGNAIGKYLRIEKFNKTNDIDTLKIIADEYNLTISDDFARSRVYGGEEHNNI